MSDSSSSLPVPPPEKRKQPEKAKKLDQPSRFRPQVALVLAVGGGLFGFFRHPISLFLNGNSAAIEAVGTAFIAAFTYTLWNSTRAMERGTRKTLRHLKESSEQELRGYVFYSCRAREYEPTGLNIRFKNTGQTPVKNVEVCGYVCSAPRVQPAVLPTTPRATEEFLATIAPQGVLDVHFTSDLLPARLEDSARGVSAGAVRYVHGYVTYVDAFEQPRTTHFRYQLVNDDLRYCTEGNDWD